MLANKSEKKIYLYSGKESRKLQINSLFAICANSNYASSGKVTVIEKGKKNEKDLCQLFHSTFGRKRVWHNNLSEIVHGKST